MGIGDIQRLGNDPAQGVRMILDLVVEGDVVGVAATLIYKDGTIRYVPVGCAPDPLHGLADWTRGAR